MITRFISLPSSTFSVLGISLAVLAALPLIPAAIAHPSPTSAKHQSKTPERVASLNPPKPAGVPLPSHSSPSQKLKAQTTQRSLLVEEIRGTATIKGRLAKVGDRLFVGDELISGDNSQVRLAIDNDTGVVEVAEKTAVTVEALSTDSTSPETALFLSRGRVRMSITHSVTTSAGSRALSPLPETRLASIGTLQSLGPLNNLAQQTKSTAKSAPVKVRTPRGVAGVRGTSFGVNVGPNGKTGIDTIDGSVAVAGKEQEVIVNAGYWAIIDERGEPSITKLSPETSTLALNKVLRVGSQNFRLSGQVKPMDLVYINGEAIATDAEGRFKVEGTLPLNRRLTLVVRGPSVREKRYEIAVP